jgi:hypothetical protein
MSERTKAMKLGNFNMRLPPIAIAIALSISSAGASDDGKVVLGFGASPGTSFQEVQLLFRSVDGRHNDFTAYIQTSPLFGTRRDFDDAFENGAVKILSLSPGDWTVSGLKIATFPELITPLDTIALPFTVKSGETVYIGDYRAHAAVWSGNGQNPANGVVFDVSDQSARDIPIAKKKDKEIGEVTVSIPDTTSGRPYFQSVKN